MTKQLDILNIILYLAILIVFTGLNTSKVKAEEQRHHKAHVHGVAHINLALEGNELYIEFISPAANIVGFEHHPRTEKEKNAVSEAIETLKAGENLFAMSPRVDARLIESNVETGMERDSEHDAKDTHKHVSSEHHQVEEKHHEDHHKEDEHEQHSEFKAVYRFTCKNPAKLAHIDVMLFRMYKGIEHIEVQVLTSTKQTAIELTGKNNRISF